MKLAQIATLENLSENGTLGATEDAVKAAETATEVAEGNAEAIKDVNEIDSTDTGIEEAFEGADKIEDLLEAAEDTMKEGGMSESEAKLMEITHESIMYNLGMSHRRTNLTASPIASLESYKQAQTRQSATMVTIENLKESAKTIGATIVRALKNALNVVMGFLAKLSRNRAVLQRHLDNLVKQVSDIDESKESRKEDSFATAAGALTVNGQASVATARTILDDAKKLVSASTAMADAIKTSKDAGAAATAIKAAVAMLGGNGGHLTNGRSVKISEADDVVTVSLEGGGKGAEKITAPTKSEMSTLLTEAKDTLAKLREFDKTQTKLKDGVNAIIAYLSEKVDAVRSKVGSDESKAKAKEAGDAKKRARLARSMMSKAGGSFPAAAFQAVKAVGDYVSAGIRNYKTDKKDANKS